PATIFESGTAPEPPWVLTLAPSTRLFVALASVSAPTALETPVAVEFAVTAPELADSCTRSVPVSAVFSPTETVEVKVGVRTVVALVVWPTAPALEVAVATAERAAPPCASTLTVRARRVAPARTSDSAGELTVVVALALLDTPTPPPPAVAVAVAPVPV